jgi:hypothetical protein
MTDLREEPSIASETLDHPDGWPDDMVVREWLQRAMRFLGENAPERHFTFHAGWPEQRATSIAQMDLESFLETIAAGGLQTNQRYEVRSTL